MRRFRHGGAAAIEFALVLPIMVLLLYGLVTFGAALYSQMVVSRAAEDAVRAVPFLTTATSYADVTEAAKTSIRNEAVESLANSAIAASGSNANYAERRVWMQNNVLPYITVDNGNCGGGVASTSALRVRIQFPFGATRMLSSINLPPFGDFNAWMPATLTGCATVQL